MGSILIIVLLSLSGGVARIVDKYLKESLYTADMEKLKMWQICKCTN